MLSSNYQPWSLTWKDNSTLVSHGSIIEQQPLIQWIIYLLSGLE